VVDSGGSIVGVCSKCNTKDRSPTKVLLKTKKEYQVTIFNDVLERIISIYEASDERDVRDQLLTAPTLTFTISHN